MLIFIDESGDAGFKIAKGSSQYFVISLIIFESDLDAEETALVIKKYRKQIGKSEKYEFKFSKSNQKSRLEFLHVVRNSNFSIRTIILNKKQIYSSYLRSESEHFYGFTLRQVLEKNNDTIKDAKLRLDGSGERAFRRELSKYLRQKLNSETKVVMRNLRFRDSKKDVLIQLADMIAGSIRRSYSNKNDAKIYKNIIKSKIKDEWLFK